MKKTVTAALVIACVFMAAIAASACGDKLLRLNRIYRHHPMAADTTVLVFARRDSLLDGASTLSLEKVFREDGYRLLLVNNERELVRALQAGVADVVIADIVDAASIGNMVEAKSILVIPVVAKGDLRSESDAKHYVAVIRSPAKAGKFLDAVDRPFDSKLQHQNAKLQPIKTSIQ
jgi:hypothetical protein